MSASLLPRHQIDAPDIEQIIVERDGQVFTPIASSLRATGGATMTTIVSELYTALKAAGVEDAIARAAARAVVAIEDKEQLATKPDLATLRQEIRADLAALKTELRRANLAGMVAMTGILTPQSPIRNPNR